MERCLGCMESSSNSFCPYCGYIQGTPPEEVFHLAPGTLLRSGRYMLGKVLGYGGFGVTYIGFDNTLQRKVAIKEFFPGDLSTRVPGKTLVSIYGGDASKQFTTGLNRFSNEAKNLASFNGTPGIVCIYDTFAENNTGYIVMELLEGKTVKEILRESGVLPYERANEIIKSVLTVLSEVHKSGIIHRDISPENIFVTKTGEVKVIDFGAARYAASLHSKSFSVILKPGYAPEEQYRSKGDQGPWSDVYAVAATYYKMLTGKTTPSAMDRLSSDTLKPPSYFDAVLPKSTENAIMNALAVDAEKRTRSAEDFLSELESDTVSKKVIKSTASSAVKAPLFLKIAAPVLAVALIASIAVFVPSFNTKLTSGNFVTDENKMQLPNLIGMSEEEIRKAAGGFWFIKPSFVFTVVEGKYNDKIEEGKVLYQNPAPGTLINRGSTVELVMSVGKNNIHSSKPGSSSPETKRKMPYVQYITETEALKALENAGFPVKVIYEYSDNVAKGLVMKQSVEVEENNTTVTIIVSMGIKSQQPNKTDDIAPAKPAVQQKTPTKKPSVNKPKQNNNNNNNNKQTTNEPNSAAEATQQKPSEPLAETPQQKTSEPAVEATQPKPSEHAVETPVQNNTAENNETTQGSENGDTSLIPDLDIDIIGNIN